MEYSPKKINMVLYLLEEKDIKVPSQKWEIVPNKLYIVGRSKKEADIALDDKLLSRKHAELTFYDDDKIKIRDLGSRNGTYLNKNRIEPLKDIYFTIKDTLSFGETNNEIIFFDNNNEKRQRDSIHITKKNQIVKIKWRIEVIQIDMIMIKIIMIKKDIPINIKKQINTKMRKVIIILIKIGQIGLIGLINQNRNLGGDDLAQEINIEKNLKIILIK